MPATAAEERARLTEQAQDAAADAMLAEWLLAVARGERDALAVVYGQTAPRLMAVLLRLLRRRELAEEALHDVFLRVWERASSFDPRRGSPVGWLVTIARNAALDQRRRQQRERIDAEEPLEEIADPRDEAAMSLSRRALLACLGQLQPEPRRCLLLAYQAGLSYDEMAAVMQRPANTIKSWVRRSLQRLRACLEGQ